MIQPALTQAEVAEPKVSDVDLFLEVLFDLQEVSRPYEPMPYRGIADAELMYRLKWSKLRFDEALRQAEADPSLIKTPSGGYALSW
ncbi:hypothetical protein IH574_00965 [Candidatus Bathyarchaeota archaeon]|nr:hypothetical protein [Candidatus Bathyarchaeota archaeon]